MYLVVFESRKTRKELRRFSRMLLLVLRKFMPKPAKWCPGRDLNPHSACAKKDFKSFASADFATRACLTPISYTS